jgi:hypothetical protein
MNFVEKDGVNMPMHVEEEEDEIYDPFAQYAVDHPALGSTVNISPDIYKPLFDSFFESEIFERWLNRKNSWQLHCVGGPGAGKVLVFYSSLILLLTLVCRRHTQLLRLSAFANDMPNQSGQPPMLLLFSFEKLRLITSLRLSKIA